MIRLVIFDLDQVLFRYDMPGRVAMLADALGRSPEEVRALWFESGWEAEAEGGCYGDGEAYLAAFNALFGSAMSLQNWCDIRKRTMAPNHAVLDLASRVKARATAIVLTNNGPLLRENLAVIAPEVLDIFGATAHASADFGARKPERAVFERAMARYGVSAAETAFVDDDEGFVEGARALGIDVHHFADADGLAAFLEDRRLI